MADTQSTSPTSKQAQAQAQAQGQPQGTSTAVSRTSSSTAASAASTAAGGTDTSSHTGNIDTRNEIRFLIESTQSGGIIGRGTYVAMHTEVSLVMESH
jgi:hypothetical protein